MTIMRNCSGCHKRFAVPRRENVRMTCGAMCRFLSKLDKGSEPDSCWLWTMSKTDLGYGLTSYWNRQQMAHRVSYTMFLGEIPAGMMVCHRCDVPACCNPSHLFVGTAKDNSDDMIAKGRKVCAMGDAHGSRLHPDRRPRGPALAATLKPSRGEANGFSKLTEGDVRRMRSLRSTGAKLKDLAAEFGVSFSGVHSVCVRKTWAHVA